MLIKLYPGRLASTLTLILLAWSSGSGAQVQDLPGDPSQADYPVVITPTRLRQAMADVPASVTVITAETIRRYGIQSVAEALRLVPGMAVSLATGNEYRINFHGTNAVSPRRMNVLVDGVSVYRPGFSLVDWFALPVALEDVDRIEVIRGPDSATYGPNSMMAVVSITTKHPKDVEPAVGAVSVGAHHAVDSTVRLATAMGSTSVRLTANVQRGSGYDHSNLTGGEHDSSRVKRLNVRAQHDLADGSALDVQASYVDGAFGLGALDNFPANYPDRVLHDAKLSARWTKPLSATHEIQVDAFRADASATSEWTTCWPQVVYTPEAAAFFEANRKVFALVVKRGVPATMQEVLSYLPLLDPATTAALLALGPSALAPRCGQVNQNGSESRTQVELQDTYVVNNTLRVVTGLGLRYQRADSQTYFGGAVSNQVRWAFGHAEYRPLNWLTANVGGYAEHNSLSGSTFSPRMALNTKFSDSQTGRLVFSKGTRSPDLFESRANWRYTATGLTPAVNGETTATMATHAVGDGSVSSERIWSRELGYLLTMRDLGLTLDARVFDDRLSRLISDRLTLLDFAPSNADSVRLTGAEVQGSWEWSRTWSGMLSYGYLLNRQATAQVEAAQYARHSGSVGISHALSDTWRASLAHYGASGNTVEPGYARTDASLLHNFNLGGKAGLVSFGLSYLGTPSVNTFQIAGRYASSRYDQRLAIHGQVRVAL
jgi:iron complex outermembrane recepter protein